MKKFKSIVSVAMSAALSVGIFGSMGCLTGSGVTAKAAAAPTEITAYFLAPKSNDLLAVQNAVNKILVKDCNVKVKLIYYYWDSYQDKTKLALQAGNAGDCMFTAKWMNYCKFAGGKAFAPMDSMLNKYGANIKKYINPSYLKAAKINNKLYAIPTNKDRASQWGIVYNKNMAKKYGINMSAVKKPEDLEKALKTIKDKAPGVTPMLANRGTSIVEFLFDWYEVTDSTSLGISRTGSTKVTNTFNDPRVVSLFKLSRKFNQAGFYNPDIATCQDITQRQNNQQGFMWVEQLKPGKAEEESTTFGYPCGQVLAHPNMKQTSCTADMTNSMLSIPSSSKNQVAAFKFINELFKKDAKVQNLLAWGIKGKNYVQVKGTTNKIKFPAGVTSKNNGYTGMLQWAMGGDQLHDYCWTNENASKWKLMGSWNNAAKDSPLVGFNFDTTSVQNQLASIANVDSKYIYGLDSGSVNPDEVIPQYKAAMKTAGLDKVISACQKQINTFLKAKK